MAELEKLYEDFYGAFARLVNVETGGVATVSQRSLHEGPLAKPHPHWKLAGATV